MNPGRHNLQRAAARCGAGWETCACRAFTLLELLLVLALLAMAVAVVAPSMSRFFRSRTLDSEARQLLSLTRYAQSRAVSEGVPMLMWFKPGEHTYGLTAEQAEVEEDLRSVEYELDSKLALELAPASQNQSTTWKRTVEIAGNQAAIRFTPDGFISDTSPDWVELKLDRDDAPDAVWLVRSQNRLNYELQNAQPQILR